LLAIWVGTLLAAAAPVHGQFDLGVEQTLLMNLFRDGKYTQALSEARRIEKLVKPTKKNPAPGPGTKVYIDLLIYRGTIERRMGNLDAADKTLTEAFKQLSDPGFQQFLAWQAPAAEEQRNAHFLALDLSYLQLIDNGTEVLLERIRNVNQAREVRAGQQQPPAQAGAIGAAAADAEAAELEERGKIVGWFRRVDDLIRQSQAARANLRGKIGNDASAKDGSPAGSPQARMMLSLARPYRYVGMRYLEASQLPWTLSFDTDASPDEEETPRQRKRDAEDLSDEPTDETPAVRRRQAASQRMRALAYLERSEAFGEAAMAPVLAGISRKVAAPPAGTSPQPTLTPGAQPGAAIGGQPVAPIELTNAEKEAARIRAEILVPKARLALLSDTLDKARSAIDQAIAGLRQSEVPDHPELARPLIVSAEIAFAESRRSFAANDVVKAHDKAGFAVEALHESQRLLTSAESEFDPDAPLHRVLAQQLAVAESFANASSQAAADTTAADAAARRALAALKTAPKPKPAAAPPATAPGQPAGGTPPPAAVPGRPPVPGSPVPVAPR